MPILADMGFVRHTLSYFYPELAQKRASLENPSTPLGSIFDPPAKGNIIVNETTSLSIGAYFACIKVISETMAQMDLEVVEKKGKSIQPNTKHPNYWLLHAEPSPYYNAFEWKQAMMFWALSWGNGYSKIHRDRFANAIELEILNSYDVTPKMTERGKLYYEYNRDGVIEIIQSENMIHLKNLGCNGITGLSVAEVQRQNMLNAMSKQNYESDFYANGAKASGVLMTPGHLGAKEQKNLKESFKREHEGAGNKFKTLVLEEGVKYQQLTIPQSDAQFLESKKYDRSEIAGWMRVPPYKIGDHEHSTYSNIEGQERSFAKDTIVPWTIRLQQELDRKLFFQGERGRMITQFNLDDLIKGDMKSRYEVWKMGIENGILKPKWVTEAEGWPVENDLETDQFFMNGAMKSIRQILEDSAEGPQNTEE